MTQIVEVCKFGGGTKCCRYLGISQLGFQCLKLTELKLYLDGRVAEGTMAAQGDNCEGIAPDLCMVMEAITGLDATPYETGT